MFSLNIMWYIRRTEYTISTKYAEKRLFMKKGKKIVTWCLVFALFSAWLFGYATVNAEEISIQNEFEMQLQNAEKMVSESNGECALAVLTDDGIVVVDGDQARASASKGYITGDGVRLRKAPKSTATVLELMSKNEVVVIDYAGSSAGCSSGKWFYVKRVKTGTWGWVNTNYLAAP